MIELKNVSFCYANFEEGVLKNLSLSIKPGECILLCGKSGCGKTTVTRLLNGLIPHYYEGELSGKVTVLGQDILRSEIYDTARYVGSVFQNPRSQFFCVDTTSEIAFGCENLGLPEAEILERIDKTAKELNVVHLLDRNIFNLSGGEKQKIACASVSATCPDVFVLDEPTSNLDIDAIMELKKTLQFWKSQGKTIIIAEHRLYWLKEICDRVIYMDAGEVEFDISMKEFCTLSVKRIRELGLRTLDISNLAISESDNQNNNKLELQNYIFRYDKTEVLNIPQLFLPEGGVIALIGHNGAGKSTFSRCLCGLEKKFRGEVYLDGTVCKGKQMQKKSYTVMQDVNHQLFCETVDDEVLLGMDEENIDKISAVLSELNLSELAHRHPMSLSGGQKQRVAIASALLSEKEFLVLDEPTSGLDFGHMEQTARLLSSLKNNKAVIIITHDPELIVRCCTHILHLENGRIMDLYPLLQDNRSKFDCFFRLKE